MVNIYVLIFLFLFHFSPGGTYETYCSSGERLYTPRDSHNACIPCPHGTFIAEEHHFFRECNACTEIENPDVEVLVSACNSTHDAVILCKSGFYRRSDSNIPQKEKCEKCTECPFPVRPCEGYYNTVCCPPNHDEVMTPDGVFVCKERPVECGHGQFYSKSSEECLLCPAGTFMPDLSHTYQDCLTCKELSENNLTQAVIIRPCNRIRPTLFGCKAGYFRDPTQESLQIEVPCTPCRICNRRLLDCDMFHDAVCDVTSITVTTGTSGVVDMIKQLKATFNGGVHSCILDCMEDGFAKLEDSIAQSESSKVYCLVFCIPDFNKAIYVHLGLSNSVFIVTLVLFNCDTWWMIKKLAADNCRKGYSDLKLFAYVVFVLNIIFGILFIYYSLILTTIIKDKGLIGFVAILVFVLVVMILNFVLLSILQVIFEERILRGVPRLEIARYPFRKEMKRAPS